MIGRGIMHNDLVMVRRQSVAQLGEVVVALISDEATVKTLRRRGNQFYLEPANEDYQPISVTQDVSIVGKVINVIRNYG